MTKAYYDKISNTNGKCKANKFFFDIVFPNPTDVKDYMFVKSLVFANGRYPFYLKKKENGTRSRCLFASSSL